MNAPAPGRSSPVGERRLPYQVPLRQALVRLRLSEFVAADYLPPDLMQELTAAIDGVVQTVRAQP